MIPTRFIMWTFALACLCACGAGPNADASKPAGALVESRAPRWSAADAWRLDAEPDVTIGGANVAPEYALDDVVGAARLTDGRIVVANAGTDGLQYYDARGAHLRTVGRKGNGPGEFRFVQRIGRAGDTILVWDPYAQRVSRFDGTGTFTSSTAAPGTEMSLLTLIGFLGDGSMLLRPMGARDNRTIRAGEYVDSIKFVRFSTAPPHAASLGPFLGAELFTATLGHTSIVKPVIFGNRALAASAGTGFYRAESARFEAIFFAPDGTPVRTVRRTHTPVRATAADVAAEREALEQGDEEMLRSDPDMAPVRRRLLDNLPHRSTLPAISQIRVDRQDNLWIQAYAPPGAETAEWSVFDPEGHWLGVVAVPANLEVLEIGDDYLLAKTVDPLDDVERVVLHRLRKPR